MNEPFNLKLLDSMNSSEDDFGDGEPWWKRVKVNKKHPVEELENWLDNEERNL